MEITFSTFHDNDCPSSVVYFFTHSGISLFFDDYSYCLKNGVVSLYFDGVSICLLDVLSTKEFKKNIMLLP